MKTGYMYLRNLQEHYLQRAVKAQNNGKRLRAAALASRAALYKRKADRLQGK